MRVQQAIQRGWGLVTNALTTVNLLVNIPS